MNYDVKIDIEQQREYKVIKANEIVQNAKYDLNAMELKILNYIISKIKPTDTELQEYTFSIKEYCQVCGIDYQNGKNYLNVKKSIKQLRDKSFWLQDGNGNDVLIGWLQRARINKSSGKITVKLDDDMQKFVIGMLNNYTQYTLLLTLPMKSSYSIRIYELLKSYSFTKHHTFDLEDLKKKLGATHYERFADFRRKVLEIAVKEINLYTDIEINWTPIKKGKAIIQINFDIKERDMWESLFASSRAHEQIEGQLSLEDYYK